MCGSRRARSPLMRHSFGSDKGEPMRMPSPLATTLLIVASGIVYLQVRSYQDAHPLDEPDEWGDLASFRRAVAAS